MDRENRSLSWDDYGISKHRYEELRAFCLQYDEKKSKINRGLNAVVNDGMPHSSIVGSPTEARAIQNAAYQKDCDMIEQAAQAASPDIASYIIKSVTNGLSYTFVEYDGELGRIPCGRNDFYAYRRLFYHYLDRIKRGDKLQLLS